MISYFSHNADTAPFSNLLAHRMWQLKRIAELEQERDRLEGILAGRCSTMVCRNTPHLDEFCDKGELR